MIAQRWKKLPPRKREMFRRVLTGWLTLSVIVLLCPYVPAIKQREQALIDLRYAYFNRLDAASDRVAVIDIDEESLKALSPELGRWPWPRRVYKDVLEFVSMGEPAAILFDILFTEPMVGADDDKQLSETTKRMGNVSHAVHLLIDRMEEAPGINPLPKDFRDRFGLKWKSLPPADFTPPSRYRDYAIPVPDYLKVIPRVHVVSVSEDKDGILRRVPLSLHYDNIWLPSLALAGYLSTLKNPVLEVSKRQLWIRSDNNPVRRVPLDENGNLPVHFYSKTRGPERIPIAAVLGSARALSLGKESNPSALKCNPLELKGKVIVVGGSAAALEDLKPTPIHSSYPGALLQASAISNLIAGDFAVTVSRHWQTIIQLALVLLSYLSFAFLPKLVFRFTVPVVLLFTYVGYSLILFRNHSIVLELVIPIAAVVIALIDYLTYEIFMEARERKKAESALSKYLSPAVVQELIATGMDPRAEIGRHQELSIMFTDIRDFTTISEKYQPLPVVECLNEYFKVMTDLVFSHYGTLDKLIGDSVMAFWGAPLACEDHADKAIYCAFHMRDRMLALKGMWKEKLDPDLDFRSGVGINSGNVIVGNVGSEMRLNYTVIGDNVNLAARIEGLTKTYGVTILIGQATHAKIKERFLCRFIDEVQVKGKSRYIRVYEPLADMKSATPELRALVDAFDQAMKTFQRGDLELAHRQFEQIHRGRPGGDGPSEYYSNRCLAQLGKLTQKEHVYAKSH